MFQSERVNNTLKSGLKTLSFLKNFVYVSVKSGEQYTKKWLSNLKLFEAFCVCFS